MVGRPPSFSRPLRKGISRMKRYPTRVPPSWRTKDPAASADPPGKIRLAHRSQQPYHTDFLRARKGFRERRYGMIVSDWRERGSNYESEIRPELHFAAQGLGKRPEPSSWQAQSEGQDELLRKPMLLLRRGEPGEQRGKRKEAENASVTKSSGCVPTMTLMVRQAAKRKRKARKDKYVEFHVSLSVRQARCPSSKG